MCPHCHDAQNGNSKRWSVKLCVDAGQTCAQVLLSLGNLANRGQYLNASNTFTELFNYGTVPVVNENDTVAVEELRIGDNDTLSAQVRT